MKASIITLFIAITCSQCIKSGGPCEEPPNVNNSSIVVDFIDERTSRYIYSEINPLYSKDSLRVFTENGDQIILLFALNQIPNTIHSYHVVNIGPIYDFRTDGSSFDSEVCKNFYVWYSHNEVDTIKACFESKSTKCGSVFETLKIYHRGIQIASVGNRTFAEVTLYKR